VSGFGKNLGGTLLLVASAGLGNIKKYRSKI